MLILRKENTLNKVSVSAMDCCECIIVSLNRALMHCLWPDMKNPDWNINGSFILFLLFTITGNSTDLFLFIANKHVIWHLSILSCTFLPQLFCFFPHINQLISFYAMTSTSTKKHWENCFEVWTHITWIVLHLLFSANCFMLWRAYCI